MQAKLAERAVARKLKRSQSRHLLTGLIFDDAGQPMSPTHANKNGVRYRYYVSHALLQGRAGEAGTVRRVAAGEVEAAVLDALRSRVPGTERVGSNLSDRDLIRSCIEKVSVRSNHILIELAAPDGEEERTASLKIAFTRSAKPRKGIAYVPNASTTISDQMRDTLLTAIVRSHDWVDGLISGRTSSPAETAEREKLSEAHVRFLAPLAYLSPRVIEAITEGRAPADLTVSHLARNLPISWNEQERRLAPA